MGKGMEQFQTTMKKKGMTNEVPQKIVPMIEMSKTSLSQTSQTGKFHYYKEINNN